LAAALRELRATLRGAPKDVPFQLDAKTLKNGAHFTFETEFGSLDILSDPDGAPPYIRLREDAGEPVEFEGEWIRVATLDHLIAMKEASGRNKDRWGATGSRVPPDELRAGGSCLGGGGGANSPPPRRNTSAQLGAIADLLRSAISSSERSSLCVAIDQRCPNGS